MLWCAFKPTVCHEETQHIIKPATGLSQTANWTKPQLKNNYIYYSFYIKFFSLMLSNMHLAAELGFFWSSSEQCNSQNKDKLSGFQETERWKNAESQTWFQMKNKGTKVKVKPKRNSARAQKPWYRYISVGLKFHNAFQQCIQYILGHINSLGTIFSN